MTKIHLAILRTVVCLFAFLFAIFAYAQDSVSKDSLRMVYSFEVVSAAKSLKEPILESVEYSAKPFSGTLTKEEEKSGLRVPGRGNIFIIVSWELSNFNAPEGFNFPKDSLFLLKPDGTKIQPVAMAKWYTENGRFWFPGAAQTYEKGGHVDGKWLFIVPQNAVDKIAVHFFGRKLALNAK